MNAPLKCPAPAELEQLLDGSLSDERQQDCAEHMDSCGCCQARLEEIATGGSNLSQVIKQLGELEPQATSAYWPAVKALDTEVSHAVQQAVLPPSAPPRPQAPARDVPLGFLQPATDSAYLGRMAHFDVMQVLGRGGMGIVLEAFDSRLQRNVALKVLNPELAGDPVARQRFCREARAAASITHENVVAVHQVEKAGDDQLPYLVMQLIGGETLEQRLARQNQLPVREIVRIGMQAALGLAAAHQQGLIHRDIKPGNILLEAPHDRVKLTDFGLARVAEDVKLTSTGFVTGTPLYMAPEQAMGEAADKRSDLFSLGAILYEMVGGQPPFAGNSALMILKQIVDAKHRPLRELNPKVPDWLAETIDRLLAKKPDDRIQSAEHLAELLEFEWALLKTTSEDVPTVCQIEERKRKIRNRWIATAVGTTFLILGLVAGSFLAGRGGSPESAVVPVAAPAAEPLAVLAASSGAVWSVAFEPMSDTVAMALEDGSVRLWDWPTKSVKSTINAHRGIVWAARFSQDGKLLATAGDEGTLKIWNPQATEPLKTFKHTNAVRGLALAADDKTLYAGDREGQLRVWSVDAEQPLLEAQQSGAVYAVALSPDDTTLATAGSDKTVRLWNAKTLTAKLPLEGHTGPVYSLSFNRDSRRLASAGWDKMVRIWDVASGGLIKSWEVPGGDIWTLAYSPDGTRLATGENNGSVHVWDAESGALVDTYAGHGSAVHAVAFSPDGRLIASGSRDGTVKIWKVE